MGTINKARYWVSIAYPENMIDDWEDLIGDLLQYPYCYCIHDKDHLGSYKAKRKKDDERQRKVHVHIFVAYPNTTTEKHATEVINRLSKDGSVCCPFSEAVINPENKYNYLIHDTETARKQGKYLYSPEERIEGNNFDIGSYVQITSHDVREIKKGLVKLILELGFTNFSDFTYEVTNNFDDRYFDVISSYYGFFDRIIIGNYHKYKTLEEEGRKD